MAETYVLLVTGENDDDFAPIKFKKESPYGRERKSRLQLIKTLLKYNKTYITIDEMDISLYQFGAIDQGFINLIRNNIQTSDSRDHTQFYTFSSDELKDIEPYDNLPGLLCSSCKVDIYKSDDSKSCACCNIFLCKKCKISLTECSTCKEHGCLKCLVLCNICNEYACQKCIKCWGKYDKCSDCEINICNHKQSKYCSKCFGKNAYSNSNLCKKCAIKCENCEKYFCLAHIIPCKGCNIHTCKYCTTSRPGYEKKDKCTKCHVYICNHKYSGYCIICEKFKETTKKFCENCSKECSNCGELCCSDHSILCKKCNHFLCIFCLKNNKDKCSNCHKK